MRLVAIVGLLAVGLGIGLVTGSPSAAQVTHAAKREGKFC